MTPTKGAETVTEEEYDQGSSAKCLHCGLKNYFLICLNSVSHRWECHSCMEFNYHPSYQDAKDKIDMLRKGFRAFANQVMGGMVYVLTANGDQSIGSLLFGIFESKKDAENEKEKLERLEKEMFFSVDPFEVTKKTSK